MERAAEHFEGEGWTVEDISGTESYDLRCVRGDEEMHVEVKGTTTGGSSVILTKNEVEHAREQHPDTALFVVSDVEVVSEDDPVEVSGGEVTLVQPWEPGEEELEATEYRYEISDNDYHSAF